jgi:hypothetical protein
MAVLFENSYELVNRDQRRRRRLMRAARAEVIEDDSNSRKKGNSKEIGWCRAGEPWLSGRCQISAS